MIMALVKSNKDCVRYFVASLYGDRYTKDTLGRYHSNGLRPSCKTNYNSIYHRHGDIHRNDGPAVIYHSKIVPSYEFIYKFNDTFASYYIDGKILYYRDWLKLKNKDF